MRAKSVFHFYDWGTREPSQKKLAGLVSHAEVSSRVLHLVWKAVSCRQFWEGAGRPFNEGCGWVRIRKGDCERTSSDQWTRTWEGTLRGATQHGAPSGASTCSSIFVLCDLSLLLQLFSLVTIRLGDKVLPYAIRMSADISMERLRVFKTRRRRFIAGFVSDSHRSKTKKQESSSGFGAYVKNEWSYTFIPPTCQRYVLRVQGKLYLLFMDSRLRKWAFDSPPPPVHSALRDECSI
jgi:hypothetical protein